MPSGPSAPGLPLLSCFLPIPQEGEAAPPSHPGCPHSLPATPPSCCLAPLQLLGSSSIEAGHKGSVSWGRSKTVMKMTVILTRANLRLPGAFIKPRFLHLTSSPERPGKQDLRHPGWGLLFCQALLLSDQGPRAPGAATQGPRLEVTLGRASGQAQQGAYGRAHQTCAHQDPNLPGNK